MGSSHIDLRSDDFETWKAETERRLLVMLQGSHDVDDTTAERVVAATLALAELTWDTILEGPVSPTTWAYTVALEQVDSPELC